MSVGTCKSCSKRIIYTILQIRRVKMNSKKQIVYDKLDSMKIKYEVTDHLAVYTISEMEQLRIDGMSEVVKNLFLRDVKGKRHFLVVLQKDKKVNLKDLQKKLGSTSLSFASQERLYTFLGLEKGAVTPLGVLNDTKILVHIPALASIRMIIHPLFGCYLRI